MGKKKAVTAAIADTYVCIGNGLSLTQEDLNAALDSGARCIVINDVFQWAPNAFALYGADYRWWRVRWPDIKRLPFNGRMFSVDESVVAEFGGVEYIHCEDLHKPLGGLAESKDSVRHGYSSGFQAAHLARNFGAKKIILLGMDYGATGQAHAAPAAWAYAQSDFRIMREAFAIAAPHYHNECIQVINATRDTALDCFPRMTIQEALDVPAN